MFVPTVLIILAAGATLPTKGFQLRSRPAAKFTLTPTVTLRHLPRHGLVAPLSAEEWTGEVASNTEDGRIRGCSITADGETKFTIRIDG